MSEKTPYEFLSRTRQTFVRAVDGLLSRTRPEFVRPRPVALSPWACPPMLLPCKDRESIRESIYFVRAAGEGPPARRHLAAWKFARP